ncbi:MAG: NAD(P)/FAD-dependent oxidoreductase [Balneola sp.]
MKTFDLIVIGTGSGGSTAAAKCAKAGWNVAQIDSRPFGGTCALRGCDPKKVLIGAAELVDRTSRMSVKGIQSQATLNWPKLMAFKETFTQPVPDNREERMVKLGITPVKGRARFIDHSIIEVEGEHLTAKHFLIAAGAKPVPLQIDGEEYLTDSTGFLNLTQLPKDITFIGGGYISFEFAFLSALAGSKVSILHRRERPLEQFDEDVVNILLERARELDIEIHLNTDVQTISKKDGRFLVSGNQNSEKIENMTDCVIHGAGRTPDIDDIELEKANISRTSKGIQVNDYLQSVSNPKVYVAGDCADTKGLPLTPVAGFESHIVASNLLNGNHKKIEYPAQPTTLFTLPPLATVGLTEQQAKEQGLNYQVKFKRTDDWYSYKRTNEPYTAYKTIIDKDSNTLLGAHILGSKSEEIINLFAMAMNHNLSTIDLKKMIFAYPSHASDIPYML